MYAHAQRKHVLLSFDYLLNILIINSYLADPAFLRLIVRFIIQMQLSRPKEVDANMSLRFFVIMLCIANLGTLLRHVLAIWGDGVDPVDSISLDFVGRASQTSQAYIACIDTTIFLLQLLMLVIGYETNHYSPGVPDPLAPNLETTPTTEDDDDDPTVPLTSPTRSANSNADPIFHLRLQTTFQRILRPPAPPPESTLPNPVSSSRSVEANLTRRVVTEALRSIARARTVAGAVPATAGGRPRATSDAAARVPGAMAPPQ